MKNKKGFTLVELMAVIVVLAIVIAIAVPTYGKIKRSIDRKNYENKVSLIKVAATKFAEDTNITATFVKELIEQGYLQADDEEGHIYGIDKDYNKIILDCYVVLSERKDGLFYSDFIEKDYSDSSEGNESVCDYNIPNKLTTDFKIEMYDGSLNNTLEYNDNKKWWTKNNVILKTIFANGENNEVTWYEGYGEEEIAKCTGGENNVCVDTSDSKILYVNSNSVLQQNYTAKSTDKDGNPVIARVRVYIDKLAPSFYQNHADKINDKWSSSTIDYKVSAYDNESGLYGFNDETIEGQECPTDFSEYKRSKKISFNSNGKKHVCLIDNVGNTNDTTFEVTHIDKTKMSCNFVVDDGAIAGNSVDGVQWYKSDIGIKLVANEVGLSGVMLGMNDQNKETYQTTNYIMDKKDAYIGISYSANTKAFTKYGFIRNQAGTKGSCQASYGIEKTITAPTFKKSTSTYDSIEIEYTAGEAISGIAETKCYQIESDGTKTEGRVSKDNCVFSVKATDTNTEYSFQKCITSKAGNDACSEIQKVSNVGYCTEGNYDYKDGTKCSSKCIGTLERLAYSKYNKYRCTSKDKTSGGKACDQTENDGEPTYDKGCPTACDTAASTIYATKTQKKKSKVDGTACTSVVENNVSISCKKTAACCATGHIKYKDGTKCSKTCGGGTYNRLAYSDYFSDYSKRCKDFDEDSGGGSCNTQACYDGICNFKKTTLQVANTNAVTRSETDCNPTNDYKIKKFDYEVTISNNTSPYAGNCGFFINNSKQPVVNCGFNIAARKNGTFTGTCSKYDIGNMNYKNISGLAKNNNTVYIRCQAGELGDSTGSFDFKAKIYYYIVSS